jgi:hypothetical protein
MAEDPAAWLRVRGQAQRLIECLSDGGYLLLRTPWPFLHEAPEEAQPGPRPTEEGEVPAPRIPRKRVDLTIAGARGPETHEYGSTAVHLYMRSK